MSGKLVVPDILHVLYQHLDPSSKNPTLLNLVLVSRVFHSVFHPYLYKHLLVRNTNPRLSRLIKTLQKSPSLLNSIRSFAVHLDRKPNAPKLLHRVFGTPPDHFHRLVQLLVDKPPPGLTRLAFFSPRPGDRHFTWNSFSQEVRDALLQLRCRSPPIRSLAFDYVGQLDPRMTRGKDGSASLEEFQASHLHQNTTYDLDYDIPISPLTLRTLSLHSTPYFPLPVPAALLSNLQIIDVDRPPAALETLLRCKYAIISASKETLRELHLKVVPQPPEPIIEYMCGGAMLAPIEPPVERIIPLDLGSHARLEALVVSTELFFPPPGQITPSSFSLETKAIEQCLRGIDLPPLLSVFHIRIHVDMSGINLEGVSQNQVNDETAAFMKDCRALDECMVEMVQKGGAHIQRVKLSFVPAWSSSLTGNQLSQLKGLLVGLEKDLGERFEVYLGDECWSLALES